MRNYELVLILDPEADEERLGSVMDRVRRVVGDHNGEVVSEDNWGRRKLAYKIRGFTEGNYHLAHLNMDGEGTAVLENNLKLAEDVIRHLLVREDG
ncbi:MAG: 30S ribosomal protein S6 [Dehalococcoidia bacterium]